ncbi:MAG: T9SS type A sorting domain-containing protein, partial [Flavobacteriales bacterium]|nr:T9SS type A sorting domain-containing protein [Flavobacteriales bacterium]
EIQVYPNPTNDIVFADFSTSDDPYTLELTNGHGRVVRRFVVSNTGQFPVQLPEEAGIYYLRVVSELELPQCIKVVKY